MLGLSRVESLVRPLRRMVARRADIYRVQSSSLRTGVKEIVTRMPYRYAVGLMIKTDEVSEQVCPSHLRIAVSGIYAYLRIQVDKLCGSGSQPMADILAVDTHGLAR
jgi:hypothetical protein